MDRKAKSLALLLFLFACGMLFSLFVRWASIEGLLSPEIHFFSFRTQRPSGDTIKNLFLTYPTLPSLLSSLFRSPLTLPVAAGLFVTIFSLPWLFPSDNLLSFTAITSPFFLASLCTTPTLVLFFVLLLGSFSFLLQYEERQSVYHLFLGGLTLGVTFLANPHLEWFVLGITLFFLFFFRENLSKKASLLLVVLFPLLAFFGIIAFLNWIYTGQPLSFFHSSSSFSPYLPHFSFQNIKNSFPELRRGLLFLLPLFFSLLQDKRRTFLGLFLFCAITALPFSLPLASTVATFGALFFKKATPGKITRYALECSLGISFVAGWILFFLAPSGFFSFPPYAPLQEKLAEYQEAHLLVSPPGPVLVLDRDYFLIASWGKTFTTLTPEDPLFGTTLLDPSTCDLIVSPREGNEAFPGFKEVFRGAKLIVYQREATFPVPRPISP